jgi:hypothetical protein
MPRHLSEPALASRGALGVCLHAAFQYLAADHWMDIGKAQPGRRADSAPDIGEGQGGDDGRRRERKEKRPGDPLPAP